MINDRRVWWWCCPRRWSCTRVRRSCFHERGSFALPGRGARPRVCADERRPHQRRQRRLRSRQCLWRRGLSSLQHERRRGPWSLQRRQREKRRVLPSHQRRQRARKSLRPRSAVCFGGCRFDCASCPSTRRGCLLGRTVSEVKVGKQDGKWYNHGSETWVRMGLDDGLGKDLVI